MVKGPIYKAQPKNFTKERKKKLCRKLGFLLWPNHILGVWEKRKFPLCEICKLQGHVYNSIINLEDVKLPNSFAQPNC